MMRRRRRGDTGAPAPSKRARVDTSTRPELEDSQYGRAGSVNLSDAGSGGSTSPTSALVRPYRGGTPGGTLEALKCGRDGPLANIIRRLPPRSRAALAATSSTLMASVLDSCPGARWCESEDVWVRTKGSRDAGAAETRQGSGRMVAWRLRGKVSEDGTSLIGWWLTDDRSWRAWCHAGREAVQGAVVEVEMRKERVPPEPVVTAEMTDLRRVIIRWCSWRSLAMHKVWGCGGPPPGVAAGIRELVLARTGVERVSVPKGMASLEVLDVSGCDLQLPSFLPPSSSARLRVLRATGTALRRLPAGLTSLEEVDVAHCRNLHGLSFVPWSSAARLRVLNAQGSAMRIVPECLTALEVLDASSCPELDARSLLQHGMRGTLRVLKVRRTKLQTVPTGLTVLEELDVQCCHSLDVGSLRNAATVRVLKVNSAELRRVPEELTALEELDLSGFRKDIAVGFLPEAICARLRVLRAPDSRVRKIPQDMIALKELDLSECHHLQVDFLPPSSAAGVRVLRASRSNVHTLPDNMVALEEVDLTYCQSLDVENFLPAAIIAGIRKLRADANTPPEWDPDEVLFI